MMKSIPRWSSMAALALIVVFSSMAKLAFAEAYPVAPIKFLIGSAPGSVVDVALRQIAEKLGPLLGQPVIVESRSSAGGITALEAVKNSRPDGYTLGLVHFAQMSVAPSLFEHLPYDPVKDFTHVGMLWSGPLVLVVNAKVKASSLTEFTALARAQPGQLRYSSPGNGTPTHIIMEQFKLATGLDIQHIPYRGPAAHTAVVGGEVDALVEGLMPLLAHIRSGKLKALAVSGQWRLSALPDVPTFEESGIKGIGAAWVGVIAPQGTPVPVVAQLNRALRQVIESPAIRVPFEDVGRRITPGSPEEMRASIIEEIPRWRDVIKRGGIRPE